jgi:ParB family chromosome partitioning protein
MPKIKSFGIGRSLAEGLVETMRSAHAYAGELAIEVIPLQKLNLDPENPRNLSICLEDLPLGPDKNDPLYSKKNDEKKSLQTMVESIKRDGIINPIVVYKFGEYYRLIAGERRVLASKIAEKDAIPARILDKKPTPLKLSLLQWAENIEREDLSLWERITNLEKIVNAYVKDSTSNKDITPTLLSQIIGCSLPHAMNYYALLQAGDSIKQHIKTNKIKNLEKAALISKVDNPTLQQKIIEICIKGATLKQLKEKIEEQKKTLTMLTTKKLVNTHRGRKATKVNLGMTNELGVAKYIFDCILKNSTEYNLNNEEFSAINWNDFYSVNLVFKKLLNKIENNIIKNG